MKLMQKLKKVLSLKNKKKNNLHHKEELLNNFSKIKRLFNNYRLQIKKKKNQINSMLILALILFLNQVF